MAQSVEELVRLRLRAIREHLGWSLDALAAKSGVGASTISRIETGRRAISFDVLIPLARELDVNIDELVSTERADAVVIRPKPEHWPGMTVWPLSRPDSVTQAVKMRLEPSGSTPELQVHRGHDFMFVLDGSVRLTLGEDQIVVNAGESAEFSTMTPHAVVAIDGPAEVVMLFDPDGVAAHLHE